MSSHKFTGHAITFQDSIGLPSTDDPRIGENVANFEIYKSNLKEIFFPAGRINIGKREYHNPWGVIFSVKQRLTFC